MIQGKDENQFREHHSQIYYNKSEWAKLRVEDFSDINLQNFFRNFS